MMLVKDSKGFYPFPYSEHGYKTSVLDVQIKRAEVFGPLHIHMLCKSLNL